VPISIVPSATIPYTPLSMEGSAEFLKRLETALEARASRLHERVPRLQEAVKTYQQHFQGLFDLFLRKGLVREDPYNYGQKPGEIGAPSDEPFPDADKRDEVSFRLETLRKHLETVATAWKLDAAGLDLARLKRLSAVVRYLPWASLSEQSPSPTGKVVAQFINGIRLGTDRVHAVVARDTVNRLAETQRELAILLSEFASFQRERWKADLRAKALPKVPLDRARPEAKREEALRALRHAVGETMTGSPFYPELAGEVLDEELSPRAEELRSALLETLTRVEERAPAPLPSREPPRPDRNALLDAVRLIARAEAEMQSALATLTINAERLAGPTHGFAAVLHRLMAALAGRRTKDRTVDVEYLDPDGTRRETVALVPFLESVKRKVELMASLGDESAQAFARLAAAADDQLVEFVERQLSDLMVLHRRMGGVNARLQTEAPAARSAGRRGEVKGIRLELSAVKNFLVKANQRMHDYTSRLEALQEYQRSLAGSAPSDGAATHDAPSG
jgi:hypothetical protein